ncbi:MAG: PilN domain-containing protein [candidate division Zixibacteria bacterium]|nr:PilN domain-containing protein [candidate division Zixibacteria bacterium]
MDTIQINLLPKEFRRRSGTPSLGRSGYYAMGAVGGLVLLIGVITIFQQVQLTQLGEKMNVAQFRTEQLQKDIAVVDALIDVKAKIMQRMEAVEMLDRHRTVWVRILEDVGQRVPEYTWLSAIKEANPQSTSKAKSKTAKTVGATTTAQAGTPAADTTAKAETAQMPFHAVSIEGFSFTLNSLANFMINLMNSQFFSDVEMASVEEVQFQKQKAYSYKLTATLHFLSDEELKKILENESGPDLLASF